MIHKVSEYNLYWDDGSGSGGEVKYERFYDGLVKDALDSALFQHEVAALQEKGLTPIVAIFVPAK